MDPFEKLVDQCQKYNINKDIENSAWKHALILFKYLLKEAAEKQKNVCIATGSLNSIFYNELFEIANEYLLKIKDNENKIDIIILNSIGTTTSPKDNLFEQFVLKIKGKINYINDPKKPHFILVGNSSYRFETDHDHTKAIANFNDDKTGGVLEVIFKSMQSKAA